MKSLYLFRHAIAEDPCAAYPTDAVRPLSRDGADRFRQHVRGLKALDVAIDVILSSPLLRGRQTAQLIAEGLGAGTPVETLDSLQPGGRIQAVLEGLGAYRSADAVALVGHEPSIGCLAAALIGASGEIPFKKGAACRIDVGAIPPRGAGVLVWMLPPRVLRRLGE